MSLFRQPHCTSHRTAFATPPFPSPTPRLGSPHPFVALVIKDAHSITQSRPSSEETTPDLQQHQKQQQDQKAPPTESHYEIHTIRTQFCKWFPSPRTSLPRVNESLFPLGLCWHFDVGPGSIRQRAQSLHWQAERDLNILFPFIIIASSFSCCLLAENQKLCHRTISFKCHGWRMRTFHPVLASSPNGWWMVVVVLVAIACAWFGWDDYAKIWIIKPVFVISARHFIIETQSAAVAFPSSRSFLFWTEWASSKVYEADKLHIPLRSIPLLCVFPWIYDVPMGLHSRGEMSVKWPISSNVMQSEYKKWKRYVEWSLVVGVKGMKFGYLTLMLE